MASADFSDSPPGIKAEGAGDLDTGILLRGVEELGLTLTPEMLETFQEFHRELADWNTRINLTSITAWEDVQTRHFLDSLSVVQATGKDFLKTARFIDIGSGGGFPGVPLRIAFPESSATLVESTGKKATFLSHLIETLGLDDVRILGDRAETLGKRNDLREAFDLVLCRAVARLPTVAELTLPYCRIGGLVVVHKGSDAEEELGVSRSAIKKLGGVFKELKRVELSGLDGDRYLIVIEKVSDSPMEYPRRPGMPGKRPLS